MDGAFEVALVGAIDRGPLAAVGSFAAAAAVPAADLEDHAVEGVVQGDAVAGAGVLVLGTDSAGGQR
jgi:hypothetical protein